MKEELIPAHRHRDPEIPFLFVGDHPALDLLNTIYRAPDGTLVDALQKDSDVARWLAQAGWPLKNGAAEALSGSVPGSLVRSVHSLREAVRAIVETRRSAHPVTETTLAPLNSFLTHARSHLELKPPREGDVVLERQWRRNTAEETLAPLAEAAAELIAGSGFGLVKHCEDAQCVLWFLDQTKSHHRRWCSMAACGNRNKVAAYRQRKQREA